MQGQVVPMRVRNELQEVQLVLDVVQVRQVMEQAAQVEFNPSSKYPVKQRQLFPLGVLYKVESHVMQFSALF